MIRDLHPHRRLLGLGDKVPVKKQFQLKPQGKVLFPLTPQFHMTTYLETETPLNAVSVEIFRTLGANSCDSYVRALSGRSQCCVLGGKKNNATEYGMPHVLNLMSRAQRQVNRHHVMERFRRVAIAIA